MLSFLELWESLIQPLMRLMLSMSIGLVIANIIEAMHWTRGIAKIAAPLVRLGHMRDIAGASFSLAFFSNVSSNSLLAESYESGKINRRELIFANIFNSLPANLTHFPTLFFMTYSAIGFPAAIYIGLTLGAAVLRTFMTIVAGRFLLPPLPEVESSAVLCRIGEQNEDTGQSFVQTIMTRLSKRLAKRLVRIMAFTVPVYIFMFTLQRLGWFQIAQDWIAHHVSFLSFLRPEAVGIVIFHLVAEFSAAFAAASAVLTSGALSERDIVLALLVGNVLSTPMRAFRHQFPSYVGYYRPAMAFNLVVANQLLRAVSIIFMGTMYYLLTA